MINFLSKALSEKDGKPSNIRTVNFLWALGVLFCIVFLVVKNNTFPVIPNEIILSVVGLSGVKAFQRNKEQAGATQSPKPSP